MSPTERLDLARKEPLVSETEAQEMLASAELFIGRESTDADSALLLAIIHRLARTVIDAHLS